MSILPGERLEGDGLMAPMIEIWADFNAKMEDERISLMTRGSKAAIDDYWPNGNVIGNKVFLCDGEIGCVAIIEELKEGYLVGRPISPYMDVEN